MGIAYARGADGLIHQFIIKGKEPSVTERSRITNIIQSLNAPKAAPAVSRETEEEAPAGFMDSIGKGIGVGWDSTVEGLASAAEGAAKKMDYPGIADYFGDVAKGRAAEVEEGAKHLPSSGLAGFGANLGQTIPQTAGLLGAAAAGAIAGGPVGAIAAAGATGTGLYYGTTRERQKQEYGKVTDEGQALLSGAGQAAIETIADMTYLKLLKVVGSAVSKTVLRTAAKKGAVQSIKRIGLAAGQGALVEGSTEAAQQELERWGAQLPMDNQEAFQEALQAGKAGAQVGAFFGGAAHVGGAAVEGMQNRREQRKQEQLSRDIATEGDEGKRGQAFIAEERGQRRAIIEELKRQHGEPPSGPPPLDPLTLKPQNNAGLIPDYRDRNKAVVDAAAEHLAKIGPAPQTPSLVKNPANIDESLYERGLEYARGKESLILRDMMRELHIAHPRAMALRNLMVEREDATPMQDGRVKSTTQYARKGKLLPKDTTEDFMVQRIEAGHDYLLPDNWSPKKDRYGVIQQHYQGDDLVASKVLQHFDTEEEARAALRQMNDVAPGMRFAQEKTALLNKQKEAYRDTRAPIVAPMRKLLKTYNLSDVALKMATSLHNPNAPDALVEGSTDVKIDPVTQLPKHIISLATEHYDPRLTFPELIKRYTGVLNHETIHALINMGAMTKGEFQTLADYAAKKKRPGKLYTHHEWALERAGHNAVSPQEIQEEAIAEMFRYETEAKDTPIEIKGIIRRLMAMLRDIARMFKSSPAAERILDSIRSGEMGARPRGTPTQIQQASAARQEAPKFSMKTHEIPDLQDRNNRGSYKKLVIATNPTEVELLSLLNRSKYKTVRVINDKDSNRIYAWKAEDALHQEVAQAFDIYYSRDDALAPEGRDPTSRFWEVESPEDVEEFLFEVDKSKGKLPEGWDKPLTDEEEFEKFPGLKEKFSSIGAPKDALSIVPFGDHRVMGFVNDDRGKPLPVYLTLGGEWQDDKGRQNNLGLRHAQKHEEDFKTHSEFQSIPEAVYKTMQHVTRNGPGLEIRRKPGGNLFINWVRNGKFVPISLDLRYYKTANGPLYLVETTYPKVAKPIAYKGKKYSQISAEPVFYSNLVREAEDAKMPRGSGAQWLGYLRNRPGISNEEIEWLDLADWLNGQESTVTKQQVVDYLHANQISLYEHVKEGDPDKYHSDIEEEELADDGYLLDRPKPTKYHDYTMGGGDNYRELLIALDNSAGVKRQIAAAKTLIKEKTGYDAEEFYQADSEKEYLRIAGFHDPKFMEMYEKLPEPFWRTHWDEPNVLLHVRFTTRKGGTFFEDKNEKSLHIEEIQSDWHQKGRKQGYGPDKPVIPRFQQYKSYLSDHTPVQRWEAVNAEDNSLIQNGFYNEEAAKQWWDEFGDDIFGKPRKDFIPNAPLKTTWPELALKRMIRWAADEGFTKITWPVGRTLRAKQGQQADEVMDAGNEVFYDKILASIANKMAKRYGVKVEEAVVEGKNVNAQWEYTYTKYTSAQLYDALEKLREVIRDSGWVETSPLTGKPIEGFLHAGECYEFIRAMLDYLPPQQQDGDGGAVTTDDDIISFALGEGISGIDRDSAMDLLGGAVLQKAPRIQMEDAWGLDLPLVMRSAAQKGMPLYGSKFSSIALPSNAKLDAVEKAQLYNNVAPTLASLTGRLGLDTEKSQMKIENFLIQMQDRMLSVGKLIDRIKMNNGLVTNDTDPYLREVLFSGRADERIKAATAQWYKPAIMAIKKLPFTKGDVERLSKVNETAATLLRNYKSANQGFVEVYLYAKHAEERNDKMRERNVDQQDKRPDQYEAGSGMTDDEADDILDWFNSDHRIGRLQETAEKVYDIIRNTNAVRVEGALSPDFRGTEYDIYKNYVPLRSWLDEQMDDSDPLVDYARAGKGFKIRGKEDFSALGRQRLAAHIVEHSILQNEEAILRAEKNKVGESFLKLLEDNPDLTETPPTKPGQRPKLPFATIRKIPIRRWTLDRKRGVVREVPDMNYKDRDDVLVVKRGDREVAVEINDPRVAAALNTKSGLGQAGLNMIMGHLLMLNRWLAALRTSYSPEFLLSNAFRDLLTGVTNLTELEIDGLNKEVIATIPSAYQGIREALRKGTAYSPMAQVYKDFRGDGGQVAFYGIRQLGDTVKSVNDDLSDDLSGNLSRSKEAIKSLGKFVSDYNMMVENGLRLAAYKVLRDKFGSDQRARDRAAFIAKSLTVNFNMGGELKPFMNALYLFYNAGVQGTFALLNPAIRSKKVRRVWGTIFAAGIAADLMNSMMLSLMDDDGEPIYDNIPDYVLSHNMVLMDPFGFSDRGYLKLPLPYGLRAIYNAGRAISKAGRGKASVGETASSIFGAVADDFNPLGGTYSFLNAVAPTVMDPFVDLARNRDFTNAPIAKEPSPFGGVDQPASQLYWNNTNPLYVGVADWLHQITGGGAYIPGKIEISPNHIDYFLNFIGGGAGAFAARLAGQTVPSIAKAVTGDLEEFDINAIVGLRAVTGNVTSRNDLGKFIATRDHLLTIKKEIDDARKLHELPRLKNLMARYKDDYQKALKINNLENRRKRLARRITQIRDRKIPDATKNDIIKRLSEQVNTIIGAGNRLAQ